jgi:hypothetical protein
VALFLLIYQVEGYQQGGPVMDEIIAIRYYKIRALANRVIEQLHEEVAKLGFADKGVVLKKPIEANYRLERNRSSSEYNLVGDWQDEKGAKLGQLLFYSDGSFIVEQHIPRPYPTHQEQILKTVKAWGSERQIETDITLHPTIQRRPDTAA